MTWQVDLSWPLLNLRTTCENLVLIGGSNKKMFSFRKLVWCTFGGVVSINFWDSRFICLLDSWCVGDSSPGARFLRLMSWRPSFLVEFCYLLNTGCRSKLFSEFFMVRLSFRYNLKGWIFILTCGSSSCWKLQSDPICNLISWNGTSSIT